MNRTEKRNFFINSMLLHTQLILDSQKQYFKPVSGKIANQNQKL